MDPRIREHAEIIVEESLQIEPDDEVLVRAPPFAEDIVVALHEVIGEVGANVSWSAGSSRAGRAYMRAADPEDITLSASSLAQMEETDAVVMIGASENTHETSDVDPESLQASQQANQPIFEERLEKRWLITATPATGNAQDAEMSTEAYEEFVYGAINKDWDAQREFQAQMVELLDDAEEVHIVSGDTTDITMDVSGMSAVNDLLEKNLPGGEVFTCPNPESVEGEVVFDKPVMHLGREIQDARLVFEDGEVVEHGAGQNEEMLTSVLETDEGARRLGELGIGMNRDIDRFTYNMLFDEKMGDTIHLAVGRSIEEAIPEEKMDQYNESATHVDMIVDMSEDSSIELDGEVVQRNGTFVFEDGFEEEE